MGSYKMIFQGKGQRCSFCQLHCTQNTVTCCVFYSASNGVVNSEKAMYNCLRIGSLGGAGGEAVYQQNY